MTSFLSTRGVVLVGVIVGFLICCFHPQVTRAQEQPNSALKVSPAIVELILAPGETKELDLTVTNIADVPIPIKANSQPFIDLPSDLTVEDQSRFDSSRWISLVESDFILEPREEQRVRLAVVAPEDAEPGGHYATAYFRSLVPANAVTENRLFLTARVGVLVFLIITGDIQENADFPKLETTAFHSKLPVPLTVSFKNKGNVHLLPSGEVRFYNWKNELIFEQPISPRMVLPGQLAQFTVEWTPRALFGQYTAQAEIRYGTDQTVMLSNRVAVWVSPWIGLVGIGAGLIVVLVIVLLFRHRITLALRVLLSRERRVRIHKFPYKN